MPEGESFAVITNPTAGRGKAAVVADLAHRKLVWSGRRGSVVKTSTRGDAERLARQLVADGVCLIIACGGDGIVHEVVNGIADTPDVVLGVLPCGRGNDFAASLRIPSNACHAVATLLNGERTQVDLGVIGERHFATIASCGFDASVSEYVAQRYTPFAGTASYIYATLATVFRYHCAFVHLEGDFGTHEGHFLLIAAGITNRYGGGFKIVPNACYNDGLFDVCIIKAVSKLTILRMMVTLFWGGHLSHPAVDVYRTSFLTLRTAKPMPICADGELIAKTPLTIKLVKHGLTVLTPTL